MANSKSIGVAYSDPAIDGGTIDNTTVGSTTAAAGAFTTLTASGATTLNGNVGVGNGVADVVSFYGVTGTAQLSLATQATITASWVTVCASKGAFSNSDQIISVIACIKEIQHVLTATGLWKGAA